MHPVALIALLLGLCCVAPYLFGFLIAGGAAVALVVGAIEFVTAAFAGFTPAGPVGHLRIDPPAESEDGPDPAYRSYYAGPVLLDYRKVLAQTFGRVWARVVTDRRDVHTGLVVQRSLVRRAWAITGQSGSPYWKVVAVPSAFAATIGLMAGMAGAFALVAVTSVIFGLLLVVMVLAALITAGTTRVAEFGMLYLRGITIECGTCHVRATRPIYRCPTCDAAHRRLVPGRAGVLHRTCRCRTSLPTLLAIGKAKLPAQCAECKALLPVKGLTAPTVHIPVIAGPTAGKSVFMQTSVTRLMVRGDESGGGFEFADEMAKSDFERNVGLGVHNDPSKILKTVVRRPRAYNVFVGREGSRARRLLYLYDPAGETVESVEQLAEAQFLAFTKGVVFVIDPFSLRAVRSASDRTLLRQVSASNTAAKAVLERFVESLRERLPTTRSHRLNLPVAVVLTKADGLVGLPEVGHPYANLGAASIDRAMRAERDAALRTWLSDTNDRRDLVSSLDNNFATVAYFAVSYQDAVEVSPHDLPGGASAVTNDDPAAPLLWLLDRKARR